MTPKLSLIIPVFNEAQHLENFLTAVDKLDLGLPKELVIVNDGSSDASGHILHSFPFSSAVVLIDQTVNQGKGAAIWEGLQKATGDFIGIQDADFETNFNDIPKLLAPLVAGAADVVFGSRFQRVDQSTPKTLHFFGNKLVTACSNIFNPLNVSDMETCYKFFRADLIMNIRLVSPRFGFEPEITAKLAHLNLRFIELPISYLPRNRVAGKKLNWKDGVAALGHVAYFSLKARFDPACCYLDTLPQRYRQTKSTLVCTPELDIKVDGPAD